MHAWTRDELLALARGKLVGVRGELGEPVVVPDWMRSDEFDVLDQSIEEILDQVHPDDRVNLVDLYGLAMTTPGELLDTEFRSTLGESAAITRMQMINLIGDDVLGHLFVVIDPTGRVVDGGFDHDHLFDQRPADWMIFTVNSAAVIMTVEGDSERFIGYFNDEADRGPGQVHRGGTLGCWHPHVEAAQRASRRHLHLSTPVDPQGWDQGLGRDLRMRIGATRHREKLTHHPRVVGHHRQGGGRATAARA
ncbi:MAG: hypothetical protein R2710_29515 [Acidimicrobiales bacterium]